MTTGDARYPPEQADHATRIATLEADLRSLREDHASLRAQFVALAELERFRDVILRRHAPALLPPLPRCKLEARDFAEQSDGLYYLEYGPRGEAYRWTGPGHTLRLLFNVDRSVPTLVAMRLVSMGSHTEQDSIGLEVDGVAYAMRMIPSAGTVLEWGPVPPRPALGATVLLFNIPVLFSPGTSDQRDARELGVALQSVEIGPA